MFYLCMDLNCSYIFLCAQHYHCKSPVDFFYSFYIDGFQILRMDLVSTLHMLWCVLLDLPGAQRLVLLCPGHVLWISPYFRCVNISLTVLSLSGPL